MPPTGKELNVGNISEIEPNIHANRRLSDQLARREGAKAKSPRR